MADDGQTAHFTSFLEVFDHWAQVRPTCCAVRDLRGRALTWAELQETSVLVASHVQQLMEAEAIEVGAILSRRCPWWLAATVALMRCGIPFVWMGCELSKGREKEKQRNEEILRVLRPQLLLLGAELPPDAAELLPERFAGRTLRLAELRPLGASARSPRGAPKRGLLCFQLTGGTTGSSKCVEITEAMALHEIAAYPKTFPQLSCEDCVLQHTPVLWAASAIGQINIAVSCGATLCISEAFDQESIVRSGASVLGSVPSALEALDAGASALQGVRWVFTWGEAMAPTVAQRWRSERRRVVELLISTEYWLSLYSEGRSARSGRSVFTAVEGAEVAVLRDGELCKDGTGELCLRGPMVTTGYRGASSSVHPPTDGGAPFFKTSDLVTLSSGARSLEFRGRSDMLIKVGGQFVDLLEAEERLKEALLPPESTGAGGSAAREVCALPGVAQPGQQGAAAHIFVSIGEGAARPAAARLLARARAVLPPSAALHLLSKPLPKDPVSGKVDRHSLLQGVSVTPPARAVWPALWTRFKPQGPWLLVFALAGAVNLSSWLRSGRASRPSWKNLLQFLLHVAAVPYMWLFSFHIPIHICRSFINYVPFGRLGVLCISYHLARSRGLGAWLARLSLGATTALGAASLRREHMLSWWLVFWLAIPEQAQVECGWWLTSSGWKWYLEEIQSTLMDFRGRSESWADRILEALLSAPRVVREQLQRLQQQRLPYKPPEELRELEEADLVMDEADEAAALVEPEFEPVEQVCDADGPTGVPELQPAASLVPEAAEDAVPVPEAEAAVPAAQPEVETFTPQWSCVECQCPLPWGSDWRQEAKNFYCKSCHRSFDDRWWEFHTRDVIEPEVPDADDDDDDDGNDHAEGADGAGDPAVAKTAAGRILLQLLSKQLSSTSLSLQTRLLGIDSLAVLTLCRQLRLAVPSLCLRPQEVFECSSVEDLLNLVDLPTAVDAAGSPAESTPTATPTAGDLGVPRTVWFAPGQVNSTCKWLYGCRGLLDERSFRRAAAKLLARHEGLRAEMASPAGMELLRFLRDVGPLHSVLWPKLEVWSEEKLPGRATGLVRKCKELVSSSLKNVWPKSVPMRLTKEFLEERIRVVQCRSWREVEQASQQLRDAFQPPIAIGLFLLLGSGSRGDPHAPRPEEWGAPSSFLQFVVSHAYSDGFCSVPMVQDLSALYAQEEDRRRGRRSQMSNCLLPYKPGASFEVLEGRFYAALEGKPAWSHPEQLSLRSSMFDTEPPKKWQPWVYNHEVLLEGEAVALLRRCAQRCASTSASVFGDPIPGCEPYWYQGYPSAYYSASHETFRAKCRSFVEAEVQPYLEEWIAKKAYPLELHQKALAAGLPTAGLQKDVQLRYPAQVVPAGGFDALHELIYLDELAAAGPGGALGQCGINSMALPPVLFAGSPAVQAQVVDEVIAGRKNISLAISEPSAGSDVANIGASAVAEKDVYVVNGQKKWITGGHMADYFTLAVRTGAAGAGGLSLLLVDARTPGVRVRRMEMQFDSCHGTTFLDFEDVRVPKANLIGEEGKGFKYLMFNFNHERFVISVSTCRFARLCYAEALKYSLRRKTFGKALHEHQMIRWKLAEMLRQVEALHDYNERVAFQYKSGVPDSRLGAQCGLLKVMSSKTFEYCAREAAQVFGGSSLVREGPGKLVERLYREVRASAIPGGSEEVLLDLAARQAIGQALSQADFAWVAGGGCSGQGGAIHVWRILDVWGGPGMAF
ncbi:unnamed protein product [Durusdinium trenchii]|uniref:Uncharacterized protein n=2 Tax=Durusdinium trenchii TaxID=1381693 RepID=A0ABP0NXD2_9DINO